MKSIKFGEHLVPLWVIFTLLVSGIGVAVLTDYVWKTITMPFEVKEPLEILSYPSELSLYPGETNEFNITVMNHASRNYTVLLGFSLDNTTYQESYVTFSDETYTVIPDEQNLTAWLKVEEDAPPANASLTIDFMRIAAEGEVLFFDDFNDGVADGWTEHLGAWNVINGEYFVTVGIVENGISTVNELDLTDCTIEVKIRFSDASAGFLAGIVFRYTDNEHYYAFLLSNEYDDAVLKRFCPERPDYGITFAGLQFSGGEGYPVEPNTDYLLEVIIQGSTFRCFINDQEAFSGTDGNYAIGKVGLWARNADVFFDNFTGYSLP